MDLCVDTHLIIKITLQLEEKFRVCLGLLLRDSKVILMFDKFL